MNRTENRFYELYKKADALCRERFPDIAEKNETGKAGLSGYIDAMEAMVNGAKSGGMEAIANGSKSGGMEAMANGSKSGTKKTNRGKGGNIGCIPINNNLQADLKSLKHLRWLRNRIAHDEGATECSKEDVRELEKYLRMFEKGTDPVSTAGGMRKKTVRKENGCGKAGNRNRGKGKSANKKTVTVIIFIVLAVAAAAAVIIWMNAM